MKLQSQQIVKAHLQEVLLKELAQKRYRFHFPFHAGTNFAGFRSGQMDHMFGLDFTELPSLDVLSDPHGVLKASQEQTAHIFGVRDSFYLVNGASVGIMATLLTSGTCLGQKILLARNCHRSVLNALILTGATPQWILPEYMPEWGIWGGISPDRLEYTLKEDPEISMFVMTHPTYEGVVSDVKAISAVCHKHKVRLIVDEAHGSLFALGDNLPESAVKVQADAVVHSMHKSGGSLTQTALLHLPHGSSFDREDIQETLNLLQTTSPNYVLLANLESSCMFWQSLEGKTMIDRHLQRDQQLRSWINSTLATVRAFSNCDSQDGFQLFLKSAKMTGWQFAEMLEETYNLAYESVTTQGVLLSLNMGLPEPALEALRSALLKIDTITLDWPDVDYPVSEFTLPQMQMTPAEAFFTQGSNIPKEHSVGKISRQIVASCPPGIPILVPGEMISDFHLSCLPNQLRVVKF